MLGVHHAAICTADVEQSIRFWRDGLGFTDGVRRIGVSAPAGATVPMAVIRAPDRVLVELIGPPT